MEREDLEDFFEREAKMICLMAHPLAIYDRCDVKVRSSSVKLKIFYGSWVRKLLKDTTVLKMTVVVKCDDYGTFSKLKVKKDHSRVEAFSQTNAFKGVAGTYIHDFINKLEGDHDGAKYIARVKKALDENDAKEICLHILTSSGCFVEANPWGGGRLD